MAAVAESGSKDYAHADDVSYKPKREGHIAQDGRVRFAVYQMFSSMYSVYVLSCILQWLLLNGHEEAVSQLHSISILSVLAICKHQSCSCSIPNECVVFQSRHLYQLLLLLKYTNQLLGAYDSGRMYSTRHKKVTLNSNRNAHNS